MECDVEEITYNNTDNDMDCDVEEITFNNT